MLPDDLLNTNDLVNFLEKEPEWAKQANNPDLQRRLHGLQKKAAWLLLEELFVSHADLAQVSVRVGGDMMDHEVVVSAMNEEGGSTPALDAMASDYELRLNDMPRNPMIPFFSALEALTITRDMLEDCAAKLFGDPWVAARTSQNLDESIPPSYTAPKPSPRM